MLNSKYPAHMAPARHVLLQQRFWAGNTAELQTQALGFLAAGISGTVLKRWLPVPAGLGLSGTMAYLSAGGTYVPAGKAFKPNSSALMVPVLRSSSRFGSGLQVNSTRAQHSKSAHRHIAPWLGRLSADQKQGRAMIGDLRGGLTNLASPKQVGEGALLSAFRNI